MFSHYDSRSDGILWETPSQVIQGTFYTWEPKGGGIKKEGRINGRYAEEEYKFRQESFALPSSPKKDSVK